MSALITGLPGDTDLKAAQCCDLPGSLCFNLKVDQNSFQSLRLGNFKSCKTEAFTRNTKL